MIKAKCTEPDGTTTIILGLSFANLTQLRNGEPIDFDATPYGYEGEIIIFAGPDEKSMRDFLLGIAQTDADTKFIIERNAP